MPHFRVRTIEQATIQRVIVLEAPDREGVMEQYEKGEYEVLRTMETDVHDVYFETIVEILSEFT